MRIRSGSEQMMKHKIVTVLVTKETHPLGWKVYIDGKKFPEKPLDFYSGCSELTAVELAYRSAGLDNAELKDIVFSEDT